MRRQKGCGRKDCFYRSENAGEFVSCDFLLITGELRGCPIGDECTRYKKGDRKRKWMNNDYWFIRKEKR